MKITYTGLKDNKFNYLVELNGHEFNYYTGIGWISTKRPNTDEEKSEYRILPPTEIRTILDNDIILRRKMNDSIWGNPIWRRIPTENDVLECLKSDCEAGNYSFDDFCDNFGYSNDSLKALDTYRACMDTARKLRGFKFPENEEMNNIA